MLIFKKIVTHLLYPYSIILEILILGMILFWFTKRWKAARLVLTVDVVLLICFSFGLIPNLLLESLESRYPALSRGALEELRKNESSQKIGWIVVLGGGHVDDAHIPPASQLSTHALARLVEGLRLQRVFPESRIILSGGSAFKERPHAEILAEAAESLGIGRDRIVLESRPEDTEAEAMFIAQTVGDDPFILVTSAFHMPRAVALFKKQGLNPIPAPTDYFTKTSTAFRPPEFFPSADNLEKLRLAAHEYLGTAWSLITGKM